MHFSLVNRWPFQVNSFRAFKFISMNFGVRMEVTSNYILWIPLLSDHSTSTDSPEIIGSNPIIGPSLHFTFKYEILKLWVGLDINIVIERLLPVVHLGIWTDKILHEIFLGIIVVIEVWLKIHFPLVCSISHGLFCTLFCSKLAIYIIGLIISGLIINENSFIVCPNLWFLFPKRKYIIQVLVAIWTSHLMIFWWCVIPIDSNRTLTLSY